MRQRQRLGLAMALLAAVAAFAMISASSSAAGKNQSGGLGAKSVTNYQKYVGAKRGTANPKLTPVQIGFVNQQGGAVVVGADATTGAQLAVKYDNAELDGIDGHPVELVTCFIATAEEEGTTCGQKFLADKSLSVIEEGGVATGIQSLYNTLAGAKPVIVGVAATAIDPVQKNAVILFGDATHILPPWGTYAKSVLHAKTAAVVYENEPGITTGAQAMIAALKKAGVTVHAIGYDPTVTDVVGPLTSADAQTADMVVPYTDANGCVNIANALTQLGITTAKRIVAPPLCLNGQVIQALGDFPKWTYGIASSLYGDATDPGMGPYTAITNKYRYTTEAPDPWNIVNFGTTLSIIRFLNTLGYGHITPAAVLRTAKAFKGPQALGAPSLQCGQDKSAPAVCNDQAQFFTYDGKNQWTKASSWLKPPS
jgi:branched-chain amino acid transport system substrate-binding protein